MYPEILKAARKIKSGEVRGTKSVARFSLNAIGDVVNRKDFMIKKEESVMALVKPGSPLAFNLLRAIIRADSPKKIEEIIDFGLNYIKNVRLEVAKHGQELIRDGDVILTTSYATNVMEMLKQASEKKEFSIYITRAMPDSRGLMAARELHENGIDVTLICDTAANYFMPEADKVLVGGVAVTQFGLIDHIGVSTLAVSANYNRIPFYAAIEYMKVSDRLIVDERPPAEICKDIPSRNPAYDLTRNDLITKFVTDMGVMDSAKFYEKARQRVERLI